MRKLAKVEDALNGLVVIKFFATWCGPCRLYKPVFERAESRYPDVDFYEVDVDESPEIADRYGVRSVPTTLILNDGDSIGIHGGALSTKRLDGALANVLDWSYANSA